VNIPTLAIVIPAFNEERRLPKSLASIGDYLGGRGISYEVIVVDDGSLDGTADVARKAASCMPVQLVSNPGNRGKGYAVRQGFAAARGDAILVTDADLSTPISELAKLEQALRDGAQLAIGSRALPGSTIQISQPWYRQNAGRIFNKMIGALLTPRFLDTQCGFKLLTPAAVAALLPRMTIDGFAYDVEMVLAADHLGFAVVEVPVVWANSPESKVRFLPDAAVMARDLLRIRWRARKGFPPRTGGDR
jgi:dolichyl-phosphate beta-glucosyltransferase